MLTDDVELEILFKRKNKKLSRQIERERERKKEEIESKRLELIMQE